MCRKHQEENSKGAERIPTGRRAANSITGPLWSELSQPDQETRALRSAHDKIASMR